MPYIVTTTYDTDLANVRPVAARVAVATLDEAREGAKNHADNLPVQVKAGPSYRAIDALPESGGTVVLPDGTVVKVEPKDDRFFLDLLTGEDVSTVANGLDAYNAASGDAA